MRFKRMFSSGRQLRVLAACVTFLVFLAQVLGNVNPFGTGIGLLCAVILHGSGCIVTAIEQLSLPKRTD